MKRVVSSIAFVLLFAASPHSASAQALNPNQPTWWAKFEVLSKNGPGSGGGSTTSVTVGANVEMSNECGPQSETYITLNPSAPKVLTAGSNEIFRLPMRGFFSSDGGGTWGGVDLPLPPPLQGTNDTLFGSDPTLVYDSSGNLFYGYIVVFFGSGNGVDGSEMAVARSTDGGRTYPQLALFGFQSGSNHFNDKPMITADANSSSPFRDNVYIAWDASTGGSSAGGIRLARSTDHGATFTQARVDNPSGPGQGIGAIPFVGPNGELYVAWNDFHNNLIAFNRSFNGGVTWDQQRTIAAKTLPFESFIPAESFRGALVYPACDADRSKGVLRGRLYCAWMDQSNGAGDTDIFFTFSDDRGSTWSPPRAVADQLPFPVDRFNHWLSVDPLTGDVNLSFYDTRSDTTGQRFAFDEFLTQSTDGGVSFLSPNVRVSSVTSNEHDCNGVFPCAGVNLSDQEGDYEGLVSFGGVSHPVWTDSRFNLQPSTGCRTNLLMEEVFTATVSIK